MSGDPGGRDGKLIVTVEIIGEAQTRAFFIDEEPTINQGCLEFQPVGAAAPQSRQVFYGARIRIPLEHVSLYSVRSWP